MEAPYQSYQLVFSSHIFRENSSALFLVFCVLNYLTSCQVQSTCTSDDGSRFLHVNPPVIRDDPELRQGAVGRMHEALFTHPLHTAADAVLVKSPQPAVVMQSLRVARVGAAWRMRGGHSLTRHAIVHARVSGSTYISMLLVLRVAGEHRCVVARPPLRCACSSNTALPRLVRHARASTCQNVRTQRACDELTPRRPHPLLGGG